MQSLDSQSSSNRCDKWLFQLTSRWFTESFFKYLDLNEIVKLDSCICNYTHRNSWLDCLQIFQFSVDMTNEDFNHIAKWIILKNLTIIALNLDFYDYDDNFKNHKGIMKSHLISNTILWFELLQKCRNMKSFKVIRNLLLGNLIFMVLQHFVLNLNLLKSNFWTVCLTTHYWL